MTYSKYVEGRGKGCCHKTQRLHILKSTSSTLLCNFPSPTSNMVFTAAQTTAFFTEATQMSLPVRTRNYLSNEEGIDSVASLEGFLDKDIWDQVLSNARRPPQVVNPPANEAGHVAGVAIGALMNQAPYGISARSLLRLKISAKAIENTGA